jgi:hypothetical protein
MYVIGDHVITPAGMRRLELGVAAAALTGVNTGARIPLDLTDDGVAGMRAVQGLMHDPETSDIGRFIVMLTMASVIAGLANDKRMPFSFIYGSTGIGKTEATKIITGMTFGKMVEPGTSDASKTAVTNFVHSAGSTMLCIDEVQRLEDHTAGTLRNTITNIVDGRNAARGTKESTLNPHTVRPFTAPTGIGFSNASIFPKMGINPSFDTDTNLSLVARVFEIDAGDRYLYGKASYDRAKNPAVMASMELFFRGWIHHVVTNRAQFTAKINAAVTSVTDGGLTRFEETLRNIIALTCDEVATWGVPMWDQGDFQKWFVQAQRHLPSLQARQVQIQTLIVDFTRYHGVYIDGQQPLPSAHGQIDGCVFTPSLKEVMLSATKLGEYLHRRFRSRDQASSFGVDDMIRNLSVAGMKPRREMRNLSRGNELAVVFTVPDEKFLHRRDTAHTGTPMPAPQGVVATAQITGASPQLGIAALGASR